MTRNDCEFARLRSRQQKVDFAKQMGHHPFNPEHLALTRREFLSRCGMGMGALSLASVLGGLNRLNAEPAVADGFINPLTPKQPHFPGKAKRVIHIFMNGGPSHVDTFDPKPALDKYHGKPLPLQLRTERKTGAALPSPFKFKKYGQSGIEVSELFPNVAERIDDICVIRSMHADVPNHEPSLLLMNCGEARLVAAEPGLVGHLRPGHREPEPAGLHRDVPRRLSDPGIAELAERLSARRLPGHVHRHEAHGDREADREHPQQLHVDARAARAARPAAEAQRAASREARQNDAQLEARIQSFELAYRMQMEATDAFDVTQSRSTSARCTARARRRGSC